MRCNFPSYEVHCFPASSGFSTGIDSTLFNPQEWQDPIFGSYNFILTNIRVLKLIYTYLLIMCVLYMCAAKNNPSFLVLKSIFIYHIHWYNGNIYIGF